MRTFFLILKVSCLFFQFSNKTGYTPLPFKTGISGPKGGNGNKTTKSVKQLTNNKGKVKPVKQTPLHNKSVISSIIAEKEKFSSNARLEKQGSKVRPKLKAEVKLKTWDEDDNIEWSSTLVENIPPVETEPEVAAVVAVVPKTTSEVKSSLKRADRHEKSKKKKRKSCSSSPKRRKSGERGEGKESKRRKSSECKECAKVAKADKNLDNKNEKNDSVVNRCKLTAAHLAIDQLRVLTAMGGLFYAGRLSAVQAPDVYAITLDGERGNRPHIHPREEILRDAVSYALLLKI